MFTDKNSQQTRTRREHAQLDKELLWETTDSIIPNGKGPNAFPLRTGIKQGCTLLPLLFNILLEGLATVTRQEKDIEVIAIAKEEVKLFIHSQHACLY